MRFGIFGSKTILDRSDIVRDTICLNNILEEERNILQKNLKIEKYNNYTLRLLVFPALYFLY